VTNDTANSGELVPRPTPAEKGLGIAAVVASAIPWLGGPVSAVLSGVSFGRKVDRVRDVLEQVSEELRGLEAEASKDYVKTEDFEELLEQTLRKVADERSEEKRHIYALFLSDAIRSPGEPYDEQLRYLRTLEALQPDHLRVLKALAAPPEGGDGLMGSPAQTLQQRLPDMGADRITDLVSQTNDLRVTNLTSLNATMTFRGSQQLSQTITPYGQRFLVYVTRGE
jgi:hypothetical protein